MPTWIPKARFNPYIVHKFIPMISSEHPLMPCTTITWTKTQSANMINIPNTKPMQPPKGFWFSLVYYGGVCGITKQRVVISAVWVYLVHHVVYVCIICIETPPITAPPLGSKLTRDSGWNWNFDIYGRAVIMYMQSVKEWRKSFFSFSVLFLVCQSAWSVFVLHCCETVLVYYFTLGQTKWRFCFL